MPTEYPETNVSESFKRKLWQLSKELMEEDTSQKSTSEAECYRKLFNKDRTGLIDKLKDNLHFDLIAIIDENEAEQQSAIDLLRFLFRIEKDGRKFKIIDFLNHPSMQNLISDTPHSSDVDYREGHQNSAQFLKLAEDVRSYVTDADAIDKTLEQINLHWEFESSELFSYVLSDRAIKEPETAMRELERIEDFLEKKILAKLPDTIPAPVHHKSVMEEFYMILACHKLKCTDSDRISLNYEILNSPAPSEEYSQLHAKYENGRISFKEIQEFQKYLFTAKKNKAKIPKYETLLELISYQKGFEASEKNAYKFAFDNFMTVAVWWFQRYPTWAKQEGADPFSSVPLSEQLTEIPRNTFTNIMQELIFIAQDKTKITNKYYNYNNASVSLRKSIIKPDEADTKAVYALVDRLENREAVNFGNSALIKKKRDVEILLYKVKSFLYSYHSLEDVKLVNSIVSFDTFRSLISDEVVNKEGYELAVRIASKLMLGLEKIRYITPEWNLNVFSMFKSFYFCEKESIETIASLIAEEINYFYKEKTFTIEANKWIPAEIKYPSGIVHNYTLEIVLDKKRNIVFFSKFVRVLPDETVEYAKAIGLNKFIFAPKNAVNSDDTDGIDG